MALRVNSRIMIPPLDFCFDDEGEVFIGIHDKLLIFSQKTAALEGLIGLHDPITSVRRLEFAYLVVTDSTCVFIGRYSLSVDRIIIFPDVIDSYEILGRN